MTTTRHHYFVKGENTMEFIQQGYKITRIHYGTEGIISQDTVTNTIINEISRLVKAGWEKVN